MTTAGCSAIELGRAGLHKLMQSINLRDLVTSNCPPTDKDYRYLSQGTIYTSIKYNIRSHEVISVG